MRVHTVLREEQASASEIALVPDLDMAGARGSAIAARAAVQAAVARLEWARVEAFWSPHGECATAELLGALKQRGVV